MSQPSLPHTVPKQSRMPERGHGILDDFSTTADLASGAGPALGEVFQVRGRLFHGGEHSLAGYPQ
jgi:hypothetical protein